MLAVRIGVQAVLIPKLVTIVRVATGALVARRSVQSGATDVHKRETASMVSL